MNAIERSLREQIRQGRGQGHHASYLPWLRLSRRRLPSTSNAHLQSMPLIGRQGHFLSSNELHVALWLLWLGVDDLREQFPLWPFPHPHPLYGLPAVQGKPLPWSRGTLAIAADLGIDHGRFIGSRIPYVATTDLMLTLVGDGAPRCIAVALKPATMVSGQSSVKKRTVERLALEKAYADEIGIRWLLMSDADVPDGMLDNLKRIFSGSRLRPEMVAEEAVVDFCAEIDETLSKGMSVGEALRRAQERSGLDERQSLACFYNGLWRRRIHVDLRRPIVMTEPAVVTDFGWAHEAAAEIFGGAA